IRSGDWAKGYTEIANNRDRFQENFGEHYRGSPIHIYAARMHFFHHGGKETKVVERGHSQMGAVGDGMHVRDVCSDRQVYGHRDTKLVGTNQHAGFSMPGIKNAAGEELPSGFAV